jgi:DDE superfamily endonuclease
VAGLREQRCLACQRVGAALDQVELAGAGRPFYSGKHRKHGMNLQVIASPDGDIVWVSGPLPGAVYDLTAARNWGIIAERAASGLLILAHNGPPSARTASALRTGDGTSPYPARTPTALMPGCAPGERANAQLKSWHILRKHRCCP